MRSITARSPRRARVLHVLSPETKLLDLAGPLQVFRDAKHTDGALAYDCQLVSIDGGGVAMDAGVRFETRSLSAVRVQEGDLVIVPGGAGIFAASKNAKLLAWLRRAATRARMVASTCTGAFALAAAGLLDGYRAVTHWDDCQDLQESYPAVRVEPDPLYILDRGIGTSAGVTAGIDLALAIVERDLGRDCAMDIARRLVVHSKRSGGQSQFSASLRQQLSDGGGGFDALHDWILQNLDGDLRVDVLAERVSMAPRSFYRAYLRATGQTPARAVTSMRIEAVRRDLEGSDCTLAQIAQRCGFSREEHMRKAFKREVGVAPSSYREAWRPTP